MQETTNKNQGSKEPENFFGDKFSEYRATVSGAALGLATNKAKSTGGKITVEMVNKYTKRLNKIAGFIILGYILFIVYIVFSGAGRIVPSEKLLLNQSQLNEITAMCKENLLGRARFSEAKIAETKIYSGGPK